MLLSPNRRTKHSSPLRTADFQSAPLPSRSTVALRTADFQSAPLPSRSTVARKMRAVRITRSASFRLEVDESYIGGRKHGARGRGAEGKTLVLVAIEGESSKLGRVRFRCVSAASANHIESFVRDYVDPEAVVVTDGLPAYNGLATLGFNHHPHCISTGGDASRKELDHVHLVISLLKRWLMGTHQGAVRPTHLQAYLDEFAFRFNRRLSQHRGKLFHRLMQQSVISTPKAVKAFYSTKPPHIEGT